VRWALAAAAAVGIFSGTIRLQCPPECHHSGELVELQKNLSARLGGWVSPEADRPRVPLQSVEQRILRAPRAPWPRQPGGEIAATIRNKNTRMAYYRAVTDLFAWLDAAGIVALVDIEPLHVATYIKVLGTRMAKPTVKQHLAAIRMLFDWLVTGGVLASNPAASVRGPKHVIKRGKTPCSPPTRPAS
jgi:hypothetical protein